MTLHNLKIIEHEAGATVGVIDVADDDQAFGHDFAVDDARFEVVDGELKLKAGTSLDHETESAVDVSVTATDRDGQTFEQGFSISVVDRDEGDDSPTVHGDHLIGSGGGDAIDASNGDDLVHGLDGNDTIEGYNQKDVLFGGEGNDAIDGGRQDDYLYGEAGDDVLDGDKQRDYLSGGAGNDTLYGGQGNDVLRGGIGDDEVHGDGGDDTLIVQAADAGDDYFDGGGGTDLIFIDGGAGGSFPADWTLDVQAEDIAAQGDGYIDFVGGASGHVVFANGDDLTFDGVERLEW
jgi:Ca2+-binding RTX toxin-like protein